MSEVATLRSITRNEDGSYAVAFDAAGKSWQMTAKVDDEGLEVEFDDDLADAIDLLDADEEELTEHQLVLREIGMIADGVMETLASSGLLGDLAALEERFDDGWEEEDETAQA
ncbi:MAG: hypothetical protein RIT45_825 [Pseudomonadota bacterium]